jgi:hypothetical protein
MSRAAEIRDAIVVLMQRVPGIGCVHAYERYAKDLQGLRAHYATDAPQLLGWFVRRRAFKARRVVPGKRSVTTTWSITGYMALSDGDASELAMDALVDALATEFERDPRLGGLVQERAEADPAGLVQEDAGPVMFAGVLCHAVALQLITEHTEKDPARTCA